MFDVRRLRVLREVAERGTMAAAAEAMAYTPSAVSQQMASLEAEAGVPLFERHGRSVVLTEAGRALVDASVSVFDALDAARSAVSAAAATVAGTVRIGALQSASAWLVPRAVTTLRHQHPRLEVHLVELFFDEAARELSLGTVDIAVDQLLTHAPHRRHGRFVATELLEEPLLLVAPAASPVRSPAEAAEHHWAGPPLATSEYGRAMRAICREAGFEPDVRYVSDDFEVVLQLVAAGVAVSILPGLACLRPPAGVRLVPLHGPRRKLIALTRPAASARPAVSAVIQHLQRASDHVAADVERLGASPR